MEDHSQKTESPWVVSWKKTFGSLASTVAGMVSRKGHPVKPEDSEKKWVKHLKRVVVFIILAILVVIVVLLAAPAVGITEGGRISLSRMQLAYGLLSGLIAVALYVWGVGNWSRFEPPKYSQDSASKSSDAKTTPPAAPAGISLTPPPGTPAPPKGAN